MTGSAWCHRPPDSDSRPSDEHHHASSVQRGRWDHVRCTTLHYIVSNAATSIATSDTDVMQAYAHLVEDPAIRDTILERILAERRHTIAQLESIYGGSLAERRPHISRSLGLRNEGLLGLHHHQIRLLQDWRCCLRQNEPDGAAPLLDHLLLTVNAIASGLRTTR